MGINILNVELSNEINLDSTGKYVILIVTIIVVVFLVGLLAITVIAPTRKKKQYKKDLDLDLNEESNNSKTIEGEEKEENTD